MSDGLTDAARQTERALKIIREDAEKELAAPHPPQEYIITEDEMQQIKDSLWMLKNTKWQEHMKRGLACLSHAASRPSPAPAKTAQECENRNCLECPLWDGCHVMVDMPMCARATYDNVAKNAARQAREDERKKVIDELNEKISYERDHMLKTCSWKGKEAAFRMIQRWMDSLRQAQPQERQ